MKRLMVLILMVVLSLPTIASTHNNGNKKHKRNAHTNNGKHKGWYKDGHKRALNDRNKSGKRYWKKKTNAPYGSGTMKRSTSTVTNGGVAKNTGGATVKKSPTATQGGVTKGSTTTTTSNTGGTVKVTTTTSSQGGTTKK